MDKKAIASLKNKLIRDKCLELAHTKVTADETTIKNCEQRWISLFNHRIQPEYLQQVNLKDFLPEAVFRHRFYPFVAHLSSWKCIKTRQRVKARDNPFQLLTTFDIISMEIAEALFPTLSEIRSEKVQELAVLFCFFDTTQQPLQITYNWTTQELSVSFYYRLFQKFYRDNQMYLDEL